MAANEKTIYHEYNGDRFAITLKREKWDGGYYSLVRVQRGWDVMEVGVTKTFNGVSGWADAQIDHDEFGTATVAHVEDATDELATAHYLRKRLIRLLMHRLTSNLIDGNNFHDSEWTLDCCIAFCDFLNMYE